MSITDLLKTMTGGEIAGWGIVALVLLLSLIQVSPVKLNPWDSILAWLGQKLNGKQIADIRELKQKVTEIWVTDHRRTILTFARELRAGIEHSSDEWSQILVTIGEYENYTVSNHIANGVVKQDSIFINSMYQDLSRKQKI